MDTKPTSPKPDQPASSIGELPIKPSSLSVAKPRKIPRSERVGGYVITNRTAQEWVARLYGEKLEDMDPVEVSCATFSINAVIKPLGVEIGYVGEEVPDYLMVFTQRAPFKGYMGMPSSEIPQFVEGDQETLARSILIQHGVQDFKFETWLY